MKIRDRNFETEFIFRSSRSGGKGGQHVNKVESKVELNFNVGDSGKLSESEKVRIRKKLFNRIDKNDNLKVMAQKERSQLLNKLNATEKFISLIEKALIPDKIRKKTKITSIEKEKRISQKKKLSVKKELRKFNPDKYS